MSDSLSTSLSVFASFQSQLSVGDLYDTEPGLASALRNIFGESFEYPDFSHRDMGAVLRLGVRRVQDSLTQATVIAKTKVAFEVIDLSDDRLLEGVVMGRTPTHLVMSLGSRAAILEFGGCPVQEPRVGEHLSVRVRDGQKTVVFGLDRHSGFEL